VAGYNALNSGDETLDVNGAKKRMTNYFQNFSEKLYLPKKTRSSTLTEQTTQGLEGGRYFINPFSSATQSDGFEELNRIESQVEQMSGGLFGDDELPNREM
jgi:hypothetical protein